MPDNLRTRAQSIDGREKQSGLHETKLYETGLYKPLRPSINQTRSTLNKKFAAHNIEFSDDLRRSMISRWTIEVVVENLHQEKVLRVEKFRKPGTLVTSNTSEIPIHLMTEGRSNDFKKHFCGTHFFILPRYLRLLEIIPTKFTDPEIVNFLMNFGDLYLGKTVVLCKDTPAFIANRIGVYGIMKVLDSMAKLGLNVDEVDKLTGPVIGRPKSATFRTTDLVGLDTMVKVSTNLNKALPNDEERERFVVPESILKMEQQNWLGDKTGQGFYKKTKSAKGETEILTLDLKSLAYGPKAKAKFATLEGTKAIDSLRQRLPVLLAGSDKAGEFYRDSLFEISYVSHRIPKVQMSSTR